MTVTRRGFLGIGAALLGSVLLPSMEADSDPEFETLLTHLDKEGLRDGPPQFEELAKVFVDEIMVTMQRPGCTERILQQHCAPVAKEELLLSGKVGSVGSFQIVESV